MSKIFKNQTKLTLYSDTGLVLAETDVLTIRCRKPSGTIVSFPATIDNAEKGIIKYIIQSANDIDEAGTWTRWAVVVDSGGLRAPGETTTFQVHNEGE